MVLHPSQSASDYLVLLCVLRMAREGVNEKQLVFWIFPLSLNCITTQRGVCMQIYIRFGNWKLLTDILQATNFPSSNSVTKCLFSFCSALSSLILFL